MSRVDDPNAGAGGTSSAPTSGNSGARGAGNVDEALEVTDLQCIPEAMLAVRDCVAAYLARGKLGTAAACTASTAILGACVKGE
jgi:hypothetical protein